MKASARPVLLALRRGLSAQASAAEQAEAHVSLSKQAPQISRLASGAVVASVENNSPISRVAVVFTAGSRYESGLNKGVTHCLRAASSLSNAKCSGFGVTRNIQQIGGNITCTTSREHMIYSMDCLRDSVDTGVSYLAAASAPKPRPWELSDNLFRLDMDLALLDQQPNVGVVELLHKAAFRDGLGNSLFAPVHRVKKFTPEELLDFTNNFYTTDRMTIVGSGVSHSQLSGYAKQFQTSAGSVGQTTKAAYVGGEQRQESNSPYVYACLATEGLGLGSKEALALSVLQHVIGTGPYVKYGSDVATSKISQAVGKATSNPFSASCFNISYSDSGLFGFTVVSQASDAGNVLRSVVDQFGSLTKAGVSNQDVQRGKAQLKAAVLMRAESGAEVLHDLAVQASRGELTSLEDTVKKIDAVTAADIQAVAKKVINGKPSMSAVGDLYNTPYLDQLL